MEFLKRSLNPGNTVVRFFLGAVFGALLLLILPLYMQNCMDTLYKQSQELSKKAVLLEKELLLQKLEINKHSSLEYLLNASAGWNLGFYEVPTKVHVAGGVR